MWPSVSKIAYKTALIAIVVTSEIGFAQYVSAVQLLNSVSWEQNVLATMTLNRTISPGERAHTLGVRRSETARDIVNMGEVQAATYTANALPSDATPWASVWTEINGVWSYQPDISFTVSPDAALLYPTNGQQDVGAVTTFQWAMSAGAQAYYLYVGTTEGAKDVVNTGAIQATVFTANALPPGATLWARLWTEINGVWSYQPDISFTVSPDAVLLYPTNGQQNVGRTTNFQWATSAGAQAYYLYVGTTEGASDVVNTGGIQATTYTANALPPGATLWARLWTEINGVWSYQPDISFTVSPDAALLYPTNGQQNVDTTRAFQWTPVSNIQAYYLYVGTSPGTNDLVNSGETQATSWTIPPLPVGITIYARLWTKVNGTWSYSADVTFSAVLRFGYPSIRSSNVNPVTAFSWSSVPGLVGAYHLMIGTSPGGNNLYDNASVATNSFCPPLSDLPSGSVLYARVEVVASDGQERRADTVFTVSGTPASAEKLLYPIDGETNVDVTLPFQWNTSDIDQGYQLKISNASGIVIDSGTILVPQYFVESLTIGSYTGLLGTEIGGQWYWSNFSFTVTSAGYSMANEVASAFWATNYARNMADSDGFAYSWTSLATDTYAQQRIVSDCTDYRDALLGLLEQTNVTGRLSVEQQPQAIQIGFIMNSYDVHTLVEIWNSDQQRWMLLDPTFDMTMMNVSDGTWATMEDMNTATLAENWTAISYQFLGKWGNSIATAYYLDYPLLYLNIAQPFISQLQGANPMPYLIAQSLPLASPGYYYFQCSGSATVDIDGAPVQIACNGIDSLSLGYPATTVSLPTSSGTPVNAYVPVRNVF